MKHISTFLRRCHIFHKRLYFKKGFVLLLLLVPFIGLAFGVITQMESGIMTVALAVQDGDAVSHEIIETLLEDRGVVHFIDAKTEEKAMFLLQGGKAQAAWIFTKEFSQMSDKYAEKQITRHALVHVVQQEEGVLQMLLREKLCGVLYPHVSKRYYLHLVKETLDEAGIESPSEATLFTYYSEQMPEGAELFTFHFANGNEDAGSATLTAPLRGLLSVTVMLSALAVSMFYKMDTHNGLFIGFSHRSMPLFTFGYHFCAVFDVGMAMLIALYVADIFTFMWTEMLLMLLFAAGASLFAMVLERVCQRLSVLAALTPLLVLAMTVICPVFFTLHGLGVLPYLFPPYYYMMATAGATPVLLLLLYVAVLGGIYAVLWALSSSKTNRR